jgi:hypothetical protein
MQTFLHNFITIKYGAYLSNIASTIVTQEWSIPKCTTGQISQSKSVLNLFIIDSFTAKKQILHMSMYIKYLFKQLEWLQQN